MYLTSQKRFKQLLFWKIYKEQTTEIIWITIESNINPTWIFWSAASFDAAWISVYYLPSGSKYTKGLDKDTLDFVNDYLKTWTISSSVETLTQG